MGGVGNTVSNWIKGDIGGISDIAASLTMGAIAGGTGYAAGQGLTKIADKVWNELSRTAKKQAITGLGNVSHKMVNVVLNK